MSEQDEEKKRGWTEAALDAVIAWFPDLPRAIKVVFASATIYLVLCLVAQVSPLALFRAATGGLRDWVQHGRQIAAGDRERLDRERADVIVILREQSADLREQLREARAETHSMSAARVEAIDRRLQKLEEAHRK